MPSPVTGLGWAGNVASASAPMTKRFSGTCDCNRFEALEKTSQTRRKNRPSAPGSGQGGNPARRRAGSPIRIPPCVTKMGAQIETCPVVGRGSMYDIAGACTGTRSPAAAFPADIVTIAAAGIASQHLTGGRIPVIALRPDTARCLRSEGTKMSMRMRTSPKIELSCPDSPQPPKAQWQLSRRMQTA